MLKLSEIQLQLLSLSFYSLYFYSDFKLCSSLISKLFTSVLTSLLGSQGSGHSALSVGKTPLVYLVL